MITITPGPGGQHGDARTEHGEADCSDQHPLRVATDPGEDDDRPAKAESVPERRRWDRRQLVVAELGLSLLAQEAALASSGRGWAASILTPGPIVDETAMCLRYLPLAEAGFAAAARRARRRSS